MLRPHLLTWALCALSLGGCRQEPEASPQPSPASPSAQGQQAAAPAALAGEVVEIPAGSFTAGSRPGEPGRDPSLEPRPFSIELGGFSIDRLPFPNDPSQPPRTGITREEAAKLCGQAGARLCTELEWERACQGEDARRYPTGDTWDPRCEEHPETCAGAYGVLGLGAVMHEWTASSTLPEAAPLAVLRGAPKGAEPSAHRCAARAAVAATSERADIGLRCCRGAPNAATVPEPTMGAAFRKVELKGERLTAWLKQDPRTEALAKDLVFFSEPEAANTVVSRGPGDKKGFLFTVQALSWNPAPGVDYLMVTARSGKDLSFVLAYRLLQEDTYELAASYLMRREPGPVAFAYSESIRPRLHFSSCWGCPGETGKVLYRKPDEVVILQP